MGAGTPSTGKLWRAVDSSIVACLAAVKARPVARPHNASEANRAGRHPMYHDFQRRIAVKLSAVYSLC